MNTRATFTDAQNTFHALLDKAETRSLNSGNKLRSALLETLYLFESDYFGIPLVKGIDDKDSFKASIIRKRFNKKLKEDVIEAIIALAIEKKDDKDYLERVEQSLFTFISVALKYPNTKNLTK
ncbi:hypothetical protein [Polynucleobacter sp. JS-JIR-5-A7]|uniref:hypothetical protein n=1 Tax=Polynucleobacter sp. JS-JIR-5-A7 TaxID=1758395 RepID=UPI001BFE3C72|nr:hypothetical protein [Polynucleobacter sp. JS-JIR-5-A7]QWE06063.1 hypothetical protein AOC29_08050 [Polynucleobacter sp. JS-JIR-5-A7]